MNVVMSHVSYRTNVLIIIVSNFVLLQMVIIFIPFVCTIVIVHPYGVLIYLRQPIKFSISVLFFYRLPVICPDVNVFVVKFFTSPQIPVIFFIGKPPGAFEIRGSP